MAQAPYSIALPAALNLKAALSAPPVVLDFVLPGFKRGTVGGLVSPGGLGKSYWALSVAMSMACEALDLTGLAPKKGRVVILSAEDGEDVLTQRLQAMHPQLPEAADLSQFDLRSCVGRDIDIMSGDWFSSISSVAKDARLVILDTLSRFHTLDENSTSDMKKLVARLERLAVESGASVLYLHHTSKSAAMSGMATMQQAARGASVLVDNARWVSFLAGMTEAEARHFGVPANALAQYVRWNISKQNYGAALEDRWYRRGSGGILLPVHLTAARSHSALDTNSEPEPSSLPPSAKGAYENNW